MCKVLIIEGHRLNKYFFNLLDWHRFTSLVTLCSVGKNSSKWELLYWLGAHQRQFSYTVLVLYSYINHQKLNGLKQYTSVISQFSWLGGEAWLSWALCSGSHRLQCFSQCLHLISSLGSSSKLM